MAGPSEGAAEEAVTQTGAAAASNPSGFLEWAATNPISILILIFVVFGIAIAGAIIYVILSRGEEEEEFEGDPIQDILRTDFKEVLDNHGKISKSAIRRDLRREGEVWKYVRFTENDNLKKHMEELARDKDNDFDARIELAAPDEERLEKLVQTGIYSESEKQDILDIGLVPHRLLQVRPHKFFGKLVWVLTDYILDLDKKSKYLLIPEHKITDNPGDNSISIDRNIQLRPFAGVQLPLKFESFSILNAVITRQLYEASLEDQVNYSEKVNFFDSSFSQRIQELEAEAEAEQQKYSRGVAGDISNS